jgi:hypothetical protein
LLAALQFQQLQLSICKSTALLAAYLTEAGPGCLDLVEDLMERGADANARASDGLAGLTPLHIVSCWLGREFNGCTCAGCRGFWVC